MLDREILDTVVRDLTDLGDYWGMHDSPIFLLRDGIAPGTPLVGIRLRNFRITHVLEVIMICTGKLVTDDVVNQIVAFVQHTADDDDFND